VKNNKKGIFIQASSYQYFRPAAYYWDDNALLPPFDT